MVGHVLIECENGGYLNALDDGAFTAPPTEYSLMTPRRHNGGGAAGRRPRPPA